jgi:long-chain acyl-CoA synthetase
VLVGPALEDLRPGAVVGTGSQRRRLQLLDLRPDLVITDIRGNVDTRLAKRDAGLFDADGHLRIIDRAKDVGRLSGGALFAPKYIENKLKFFAYVKEAVAFGADRAFASAFVNIDLEAVGNWAERRGIAYADC